MRAVIQRVREAHVLVGGEMISTIGRGVLTLLGIQKGDRGEQLEKLISKIVHLRMFSDDKGKLNGSLLDIEGEHLIVSQFTLMGDCRKGNRPSLTDAEEPGQAQIMFEHALELSQTLGVRTKGGRFGASMEVALVNEGPVTFLLEF